MFRFTKAVSVLVLLKFLLTAANPTLQHTSGLDQVTDVVDEQDVLLDTTHMQGKDLEYRMVMMITEDKQMVLLQDGDEVFNKTLTDIQVPEISAIYGTAKMEVINNTAYIGGFNGTVYELHVTVDAGKVSVNTSIINLNLTCTTEVFTSNGSSVVAACFDNNASTLYIVNVHSPGERSQLKFTSVSDLSNIVVVGKVFYFAQSDKLFSGDTSRQRVVETLEDCIQPWLISHRDHFIIIHCQEKSIVFLPYEWSSAPGIWKGTWEDEKVHPCYGTGTAPLIFSSNRTTITLYDIRNDFQKAIRLNGIPDVETITCAQSDDELVLVYKESQCNCWMKHTLNNQLEDKNSSPIPFANGMLSLSTSRGEIDQGILLFYSNILQYLLVPSTAQTLLDLNSGFAYSHITSKVVLYHGMILESSREHDGNTGKDDEPNNKSFEESHSWTVPLVVGTVVLIVSTVVLGLVFYTWRRRHRNRINEGVPTEDTHRVRSSPTVDMHSLRSNSTEDAERLSRTEDTRTLRSSTTEDAERSSPTASQLYTDNHKMIITQATETHLNSIV